MRRLVAVAAIVAATSFVAAQPSSLANLKTTAEASGFKSTSTYEDVVKFMKAVDEASPIVFYTTYGTTTEGRAMPMAVVGSGLKDASPAAVKASGKLRVHVQANVHAGQVEGKESAQVLLRELALGQHKAWLDTMVFLITPIYNADGNEKVALGNRQRQNGPINGMGTRANAQNLNINRDYMKLDTPEAKAFVKLMNDYDPDVSYDLHTSDGSYHGYYLTYSPPLNPDTDPAIMKIMTDEWFPFVTRDMKAKHGWDSFYYGNASTPRPASPPPSAPPAAGQAPAAPAGRGAGRGQGAACTNAPPPEGITREWRTFEHVPRFHNNYVGLRNRFALLSEAYAYATFEDRIKATNYFLEASLDFASANAAKLKKAIADADRASVTGRTLATTAKFKTGGTVDILMGDVEPETNPLNQAVMCRRKDVTRAEKMTDMMWFEPATTELVPAAYYVPVDLTKAIDLLRAHGLQMREAALPATAEGFAVSANTAGQTFEGHTMRKVEGAWGAKVEARTRRTYLEVRTDQPLGRLAFYLLEPASDDGLAVWNYLDEALKDGATAYPILRKK